MTSIPHLIQTWISLPQSYGETSRRHVQAMMDDLDLQDVWRYHNTSTCKFTFHRANQATWLLIHLTRWVHAKNWNNTISDHTLITLFLSSAETRRGPGIWHFNNALLNDDHYVLNMIDTLKSVSSEPTLKDPVANWKWIKYTIWKETSEYEKKLKEEIRQGKRNWTNC